MTDDDDIDPHDDADVDPLEALDTVVTRRALVAAAREQQWWDDQLADGDLEDLCDPSHAWRDGDDPDNQRQDEPGRCTVLGTPNTVKRPATNQQTSRRTGR